MLQHISKSQYGPEGALVADIIRVAAHGGYLLSRKYLDLMDKCEIYTIAIVTYTSAATSTQPTPSYTGSWDLTTSAPVDWETYFEQEAHPSQSPADWRSADPLLKYLSEPLIDPTVMGCQKINSIAFWEARWKEEPALARFSTDYCSVPATTVDAERAFSQGRWEMNFMQHNTSHDTFKASMAIGSWVEAPFFQLSDAVRALEAQVGSSMEVAQAHRAA
ncbi:hypothetical protein PQX77_006204 [Marasmius sp. AFHP31]|nr:hypothetical protein PQX77_006204 [Marasmius sp. AFHP31]